MKFSEIKQLESGHYRVAFEKRTQWNCDLIVAEDGVALFWIDTANGPKRDREFPLEPTTDDLAVTPAKPAWGALTKLVAR